MRHSSTAMGYIKRISCLNEEKDNTGIGFSKPAINFAIRPAMMNSTSKQQQQRQLQRR